MIERSDNMNYILGAVIGTGFMWVMTSLGAMLVLLFKGKISENIQRIFLGFAAGVMIAASVWSLLIPAIEEAESRGTIGWIPAGVGFILGVFFLMMLDLILPHMHPKENKTEGIKSSWQKSTLLVTAVTLHNIPEGMAVGLAFAMATQHGGDISMMTGAMALAIGMGIQNFPEGAAVAMPLRRAGISSKRAFLYGSMSGAVEPVFGIAAVLLAGYIIGLMPVLLSFAAGSMMYVVVEELIPEANLGEHSHIGTLSVMAGFLVMMVLDVALG